ncbi:YybH family protein [Sphingobium subterraneum]|uniref:Ketosteroid isomerase-like protein n=1 Tax=Sphingobium subterraneum TaxID=627688 RepID=A0A841J4B4_9SPHN|nr:nuclear transport factor 2 family protein [Sphingobium subterraneum]MBB6123425.1 ketosteroid isomerase-like protein [Sphingobium subterraneum]
MKTPRACQNVLPALIAVIGTVCAPHPSSARPVSADETRIAELRKASNAAIAAHDSKNAVAPMTDETIIVTSGGSLLTGRVKMQAAFDKSFSDPKFLRYVRSPNRIAVTDGLAMERGVWEGRWTDRSMAGCYLTRWERPDGQWRIKAEMYVPADPSTCVR